MKVNSEITRKFHVVIVSNIQISYDPKPQKYIIRKFVREYNHSLSSQDKVQFLRSHINISEGEIMQARTMQGLGMKMSQIMKMFILQSGGYENMIFPAKDCFNELDMRRGEETVDEDAQSAVGYLVVKQDRDPFFHRYDLNNEGKMRSLFGPIHIA